MLEAADRHHSCVLTLAWCGHRPALASALPPPALPLSLPVWCSFLSPALSPTPGHPALGRSFRNPLQRCPPYSHTYLCSISSHNLVSTHSAPGLYTNVILNSFHKHIDDYRPHFIKEVTEGYEIGQGPRLVSRGGGSDMRVRCFLPLSTTFSIR